MPVEKNNKRPMKTPKPRQLGGGLLILLTLLLLLNFILPGFLGPRYPQVFYSDFIKLVENDKVAQAVVSNEQIRFEVKPDASGNPPLQQRVFVTMPVGLDLDLPKILRSHNVKFSAPAPDNSGWIGTLLSWVVPPLIFFGIS